MEYEDYSRTTQRRPKDHSTARQQKYKTTHPTDDSNFMLQFSTTKESTKKTCLVKYDRKNKKPQIFRPFIKDPVIFEKSKFYFETSSLKEKSFLF